MNTWFSEGKVMKQFENLHSLRETPLFLSNFFITPLFVHILKTRTPLPVILGWEKPP